MIRDFDDRRFDPGEAADLRRKRQRGLVEVITLRAELLPAHERALVEAIYREGASAKDVALLRGAPPKRVRRELRRLVQRLLDPRFLFVARNRESWPRQRRKVATTCVLHGLSMRDAAARLELSLHTVRRHMQAVQTLFEAERAFSRPPAPPANTSRAV